jgi:hypothetical protein
VDYVSAENDARTDGVQSETGSDFRVSFESRPLKPGPKAGNWRRMFDGFVYFIRADDLGFVKIGYTCKPSDRLSKLQIASPHELRMIGHIRASMVEEGRWHSRFAHLRVRGEWFRLTTELEEAISAALNTQSPKEPTP